ncbi:hypothetical protein FN846DRAFT_889631 [Sphaerosporella brunnea]|uniref:Uncharacterized protein n=1 Tax=Sphaerosporella brunnea TaxID=1250544 RepID=A0A5J5EZA1_9PEZI|nr:hypothetical protein FN846DRAFT_889631 [Sphaerosporella brunnea]
MLRGHPTSPTPQFGLFAGHLVAETFACRALGRSTACSSPNSQPSTDPAGENENALHEAGSAAARLGVVRRSWADFGWLPKTLCAGMITELSEYRLLSFVTSTKLEVVANYPPLQLRTVKQMATMSNEDPHDAFHRGFAVFERHTHPLMIAGSQSVRWMGVHACADIGVRSPPQRGIAREILESWKEEEEEGCSERQQISALQLVGDADYKV